MTATISLRWGTETNPFQIFSFIDPNVSGLDESICRTARFDKKSLHCGALDYVCIMS